MILILGGCYQGKRNYAASLCGDARLEWTDGAECGEQEVFTCPCVYNFHQYLRRFFIGKNEAEMELFVKELEERNPELLLVCDEVGAGIVPVSEEERRYRECVGRFSCLAAAAAEEVHRVVCGLGIVLKKN